MLEIRLEKLRMYLGMPNKITKYALKLKNFYDYGKNIFTRKISR